MRILMATMGLDIGGAETHIVELSKCLKAQGHDVLIASNGGIYVPEIEAVGIRHYSVPMHRRDVRCMMRSRQLLERIIRQERPDIVHAHARIPAFLCGTLQRKLRFPFVTTAHWVFDSRGMVRYLTNWGQRTIAVSEDIRDYLIREYSLPPEHITVTVNGIDTDKFSLIGPGEGILMELGLDSSKPVVCHVSRLDEDRALVAGQLVSIAGELDRVVPGIQILIAGGGNTFERLRGQADEVNRKLGRTCIVMTGPRSDVNRIVAAGDLFVGVSRAALEAMSAAKPVILAGNEGCQGLFSPDQLERAREGNFCCRGFPLPEPEQLRDAVLAALSLPEAEREALGAYGRQVILEHYSVRRMAEDCLGVYDQVRRRQYHVVMSGYYGFSNAGDDAILQSICQGIAEASDEVALTVLSNEPALTQRLCGVQAEPRFRAWRVFQALRRCDALLSGGGSLLQDRTSTRSLMYYLTVIRAARLLGKPVVLYANGIGPVQRPANRRRVRRAVEHAALVTLRDHASARELREMGVKRADLYVTADPVFNLAPAPEERGRELVAQAGLPRDRDFAVVSVRGWPGIEDFPRKLAGVCDHLRRTHGLEILLLMMQPERDRAACEQVRQAMEEPSYLLDAPCTPQDLMAVLGLGKLCLAMRLHTLIFAARMAVPCAGLVYDPKVESYLQELDMPSAGHVERFDEEVAIACVDQLMAGYDESLERLREKSGQLARAARENERLLIELLSARRKKREAK